MFAITQQDEFLAKKGVFTLEYIQKAYEEQSPSLAELICKLVHLDPAPREMFIQSNRGGSTFDKIHAQLEVKVAEQRTILRNDPKAKTKEGIISRLYSAPYIWRGHENVWRHLTSDTMQGLLPERVGLHELIMQLWNDNSAYAREQLLDVLRFVHLSYGAWKAVKTIFKEAEVRMDWEVYAILDGRFDTASTWYSCSRPKYIRVSEADQAAKEAEMAVIREQEERQEILEARLEECEDDTEIAEIESELEALEASLNTAYENRTLEPRVQDWDYLMTEVEPDSYGDYHYSDGEERRPDASAKTIAYLSRRACRTMRMLAKDFPEAFTSAAAEMLICGYSSAAEYSTDQETLWKQDQRSLMRVVEQSRNEDSVSWAYDFLKEHFRKEMKEVSGEWLYRVSRSKYDFTHRLALDYLQNVTGVEKGNFEGKGYHKTIIGFLGFGMVEHSDEAIHFACEYLTMMGADPKNANWIADELPLEHVARLMRSDNLSMRNLGMSLIQGTEGTSVYDERLKDKAFGLHFFTVLLNDNQTSDFAQKQIRTRYNSLSPAWYVAQLTSSEWRARNFAEKMLKDDTMVAADGDWADFCIQLLSKVHDPGSIFSYAWQWLNKVDANKNKLINDRSRISIEFLRSLFVHPNYKVRGYALTLVNEKVCTPAELGVEFLKSLSTTREHRAQLDRENPWTEYLGDHMYPVLVEYLKENIDSVYDDRIGSEIRTWLVNECTLADLGLEWTFERVGWFATQYSFVREIFKRDVTLEEVSTLLPPLSKAEFQSESTIVNGARQIAWYVYNKCLDASSPKANFYKSLLMERNPRYRAHKRLPEMTATQVWPQETFDFAWFKRWATSKREPIRAYAIELSRYEMAHWIESGHVGFKGLRPFFSGDFDVQSAVVKAIYKPVQPVNNSRIDVRLPSFKPSELYTYCFTDNDREVNFALQLIMDYPGLFGKPDDLLSLSDSKNARVRQTVIMVMWSLYKVPTTTPGWRPFPYSVVPFNPSRAIDPIREVGVDPNTLSGKAAGFNKSKWFVGVGSKEGALVSDTRISEDAKFDLHEFLRRILYTLPRSPEGVTAEEAARAVQQARQMGTSTKRKTLLHASWKNKKTLVAAIRDLAIRVPSADERRSMTEAELAEFYTEQKEFAQFVLPVLEEFKSVRSKMLHNACLTALFQIKAKHQL